MKVKFIKSEKIAKDIVSFYFEPETKLRYIAGQYIELYLPHQNTDDRGQKRWFTLSSAPDDEFLSITTKIIPERSSFKNTLAMLKNNDLVDMSQPMGDFILPKDNIIPIVFIGGGIGVTPYHSIIADLKNKNEKRNISLIYYANSEAEIAFVDTFNYLDDKFYQFTDTFLSAEQVINLVVDLVNSYFYISGPEPVVEQLQKDFLENNIPKNHIYTDFFPGYTTI